MQVVTEDSWPYKADAFKDAFVWAWHHLISQTDQISSRADNKYSLNIYVAMYKSTWE